MERELLLEIGCEELPASWLVPLADQLAARLQGAPGRTAAGHRRADRGPRDAAAPGRRGAAHRRAADRSRRDDQRPAGVGRLRGRRAADPCGPRLRQEERRRGGRARRAPRRPKGIYLDVREEAARQDGGGRAARPARAGAARSHLPEADALGRVARRREGRVPVRAPDPLAAVPLRRPRRAVHHPPHGAGELAARAGRAHGRHHLRPPLPRRQRAPGARGQGAKSSPTTRRAWREHFVLLERQRAPDAHHARTRRARAAAGRPRHHRGHVAVGLAAGSAPTSSSTRRSSPARSRRSSSRCPRRC